MEQATIAIAVREFEEGDRVKSQPQIRVDRIERRIRDLAKIGATPNGGVTRLSYTALEREAHTCVGQLMSEAGMTVEIDSVGNTLGVRAGKNEHLPLLVMGSHVDTVIDGGWFDGAAGVIAAVEAVQALDDADILTTHPLGILVLAGEEGGSRFGEGRLGSQMIVGRFPDENFQRLKDADGVTLGDAMIPLGFDPSRARQACWPTEKMSVFIELHIEQGRVLDTHRLPVGVVEAIAASTRWLLKIAGRTDHSGATPMNMRKDALAAAAEIVLAVEDVAKNHSYPKTVGTVGVLRVKPGSVTIVPGYVEMLIDLRDIVSEGKQACKAALKKRITEVSRQRGVKVELEVLSDEEPVRVPEWVQEIMVSTCKELEIPHMVLPSGAGHDAAHLAEITDIGMIFVPSRDGVSHHFQEWTDFNDIALGAKVLVHSLLRMDEIV